LIDPEIIVLCRMRYCPEVYGRLAISVRLQHRLPEFLDECQPI